MVEGKYNSVYKKDNIRQVRRTLKMTQKEFLEYFLMKENGKTAMSVATLSNLESKGGDRLNEVISAVSGRLQLDSMMFSLEPQEFLQNLETCLNSHQADDDLFYKSEKKGNISQLVNRLTMYFADEILEGRLKRGDQIESDRELAKKLNVGRSAVREALKVLDVLGMIDIRLGQGTYITSRETNFFSVPLSWSLFLDGAQVKSILQVRGALELRAVQLAAQCEDKNKLDKLTDIYYRMQKTFQESKDSDNLQHALQETLDADIEFHTCIAECSGNPIILSMLTTIRNFLKRVSGTGMVDAEQLQAVVEEHQKLYGAIISGNVEAATETMMKHLAASMARYKI
ncbi:FadR/GntR family transcriptional regulator [Mogibacterium sp.]|uniref:FadR/GntR family transcriptional regulator n=1 Tax=Mogibacterium sp. TaxID=2049035 RepID=UPI001A5F8649|nr:FadR/GntR family transcriptional regulator [Mogibacterium sp.]MBL6469245.1 FadR family transcriptional regulator [Mogibacterium sp.]MBN2934851.1 FadR family transcriptional regulator [Mogibacterium sp.]